MKRKIVVIHEAQCDGCGLCVTGCHEGALQIIDGKARLVSDLLCDGLGACIGECPRGAITIEERAAAPYNEIKVMETMILQGGNTLRAHLKHLRDHGQHELLKEAVSFLREKGLPNPLAEVPGHGPPGGCPGSRTLDFRRGDVREAPAGAKAPSMLRQWPVQLHLVSPMAPYFRKSDLVVAADCTAFAYGNFHEEFLKGRSAVIACPKLDDGQDRYVDKLRALIDEAEVSTITVVTMEVPCCIGLLETVKQALAGAARKAPVRHVVLGIQGGVSGERRI